MLVELNQMMKMALQKGFVDAGDIRTGRRRVFDAIL